MNNQVLISFGPHGKRVSVSSDYTVLEAAQSCGVMIDSICGSRGRCGKCLIKDLSGIVENPTETEKELLSPQQIREGIRLACQTKVREGLEVQVVYEETQQGLRGKDIGGALFNSLEGRIKKRHIDITPPSEKDQASDWDRITRALPEIKQFSLETLKRMPGLLREADFKLTFTLFEDEILTGGIANSDSPSYGLAIDLGTTTVAAYMVDLESNQIIATKAALNKQIIFGADVISRINVAQNHPDGLGRLQKAAVDTINMILDDFFAQFPLCRANTHLLTLVGNPAMIHLFLGLDPQGLAKFPFAPVFSNAFTLRAAEAGLTLPPHTRLEILPLVSAYVGADALAAALAVNMDVSGPPRLLLDIGTNGEVVLTCKDKIWACSTAAGPALEGGAIKFGMRAEPGAISAVKLTDDVKLSIIGMHQARGLCGSGLLDAVAQMLGRGLIGMTGRMKSADSLAQGLPGGIAGRLTPGDKGQHFFLTPEIYLTQEDISQLQLAKGAMRAGIDILMQAAEVTVDDLEEVMLAGAFGAGLRPESLITIGLLPPLPLEKIRAVGNAAGEGAVLCLLSHEHHQRVSRLAGRIKNLELSLHKDFQDRFIKAIKF